MIHIVDGARGERARRVQLDVLTEGSLPGSCPVDTGPDEYDDDGSEAKDDDKDDVASVDPWFFDGGSVERRRVGSLSRVMCGDGRHWRIMEATTEGITKVIEVVGGVVRD